MTYMNDSGLSGLASQQLLAQDLELGSDPIRGAGVIGDLTQQQADTPRGAMDLLLSQLSNIIGFLTIVGGLFFVIFFLIAAFEWLRAGDDKGKIEKAQQRMINAAIGLLIMIVTIGIVGIVGGVFGLEILNPTDSFVRIIDGR